MSAFKKQVPRPRPTSADQAALDLQLSLRHWSGQDRRSAAAALGVSVSYCTRRERVLELPPVRRTAPDFDPHVAERNIQASGYRLVPCRAHRAHGVEFHFWAHRGHFRYISRHAVVTLLPGMNVAGPAPATPDHSPEA